MLARTGRAGAGAWPALAHGSSHVPTIPAGSAGQPISADSLSHGCAVA